MAKVLMKGNEALGEAAIRAGCVHFFGYPITPQTEVPEYLVKRLPEVGGAFVQAESEVASIHMVYGAAGAGVKCMTSSSSPGISLMAEGMSYLAACELPCVIINIMRAGPGLGGILPSQSDYFQATKGHGHGDYQLIVLAPASVQEAVDLRTVGRREDDVLGPDVRRGGDRGRARLHPRDLHVLDPRVQREAPDRVHQQELAVGRPAPRPANRIKPRRYPALHIGKAPGARVIGDAVDRWRAIADATHHQSSRHCIGLPGAHGLALRIQPRALDDDALDLSLAFDHHRLGEEIELDRQIGRAHV